MQPIKGADLHPGDLVFMDAEGAGRATHVGMMVGDLNDDRQWDAGIRQLRRDLAGAT